jgi:hypothetical protein
MEEKEKLNTDWRLQKISIEFQTWGEHKGKYAGKISFENKEQESFSFNIRPDMAQAYIDLMSQDIVKCAEDLGSRLIDSLGLNSKKNEINISI